MSKACPLCSALENPSRCEQGHYDSRHIGPWSQWQGHLNAELMVVGQDWGDTNYFIKNHGLEAQRNPTNNMLRELLGSIGIDVGLPHDCRNDGRVFLTNFILCLKTTGGLQGNVKNEWFSNCGSAFLLPLIEFVGPKVLVCLGARAWRSVTAAFDQPACRFRDSVENPRGVQIMDGGVAMAIYHCGARILNTHRRREQQFRDWQRIGNLPGLRSRVTRHPRPVEPPAD
jgi:DNA polymerase